MPPIRSKKVTPKEQRIAKAIKAIKDGTVKNASVAARQYFVPYSKLYHQLNGRSAANSLGGHNKALSVEQEKALLLYIDQCHELGRACKHKHIELAANSLLLASSSIHTVSASWTTRFIKRIGCLRHRTKPLSVERKAAQKRADIELHFEKFRRQYQELRMKPENLHNFDETGFQIGCLGTQIVFTRTDKQVYILDPNNHEIVTSMESISGTRKTTDLMMIMAGLLMKEKHFLEGLNDGIWLTMSELGYTNDILSFEWLKHFDL